MRIKICGLRQEADACFAAELGVDLLGFVFEPESVRYVGAEDWSPNWLTQITTPKVAVFGRVHHAVSDRFDFVQGFDWQPGLSIGHPRIAVRRWGEPNPSYAEPDGVVHRLVDAYHPDMGGGSGSGLDWSALREALGEQASNFWLAGGLTPETVGDAIRIVRPYGVDVSSGVESSPGQKDPVRIAAFVKAVRLASEEF